MAKVTIYNKSGKKNGEIDLPEELFGLPLNRDLLYQVSLSSASNLRAGTAHTKDRSEVSGGGKKPWRQKGTGSARHGSRRSPIWIGGGTTFGPRSEKNYSRKINKKVKAKALLVSLSQKVKDNELALLDSFAISKPKTKEAFSILDNLAKAGFEKMNYKSGRRVLVVVPEANTAVVRSFSNLKSSKVVSASDLNVFDTLQYKYVLVENPEKFISQISGRLKALKEKGKKIVKVAVVKKAKAKTKAKSDSAKAVASK